MIENDIFSFDPYDYEKVAKHEFLNEKLIGLTRKHYARCPSYERILDAWPFDPYGNIESYQDIPYLPVRVFKEYRLSSVEEHSIVNVLHSSGTTGQAVSHILLDDDTADFQRRLLSWQLSSHLGKFRRPMIVLDSPGVLSNPTLFSARGAGILGFSFFSTDRIFALDEHMEFNEEQVSRFLEKHKDSEILLFGFTFIIWQHVCEWLRCHDKALDISKGTLFHGGGWKRMVELQVDNTTFKEQLADALHIRRVNNFYGMVEQTGTIHIECEHGHLHTPLSADIIIRRAKDYSIAEVGEEGIVQTCSIAPLSYPGHSLLTDDIGVLLGEDDCPCGRKGKYFLIKGRIQHAELRGCSDSYAKRFT